ncbi:hypothetical protein C6W19_24280 [Bacillus sp. RJGP41]|nr:hypothetical protein C6W19_24280 [Bacillus sp. RJGP41]
MEWIYKYFSYTAFIAGLGFLIKYLIQKKIDSYFSTKLEKHKQELAVLTERSKYDISRKLFDFEAYAIKKHTIYPELYQRVNQVWDQLSSFTSNWGENFVEELDLDKRNKRFSLENKEIGKKIVNEFEQFHKEELFLSRDVTSAYWDLLVEMQGFSILLMKNYMMNLETTQTRDKHNSIIGNLMVIEYNVITISGKVDFLRDVMYKELSYSHFEETDKKV